MDDNKNLFQRWFSQVVTLEEAPVNPEADSKIMHLDATQSLSEGARTIKPGRHWKRYAAGIAAVFAFLSLGWLLASLFLSDITVGNKTLSSRANNQDVLAAINQEARTYRLNIKYPDGKSKKYPLADMGLSVDQAASINALSNEKSRLGNRLRWWKPVEAKIVLKTDSTKLNNFIASETSITVQPSQDAVLSIEKGEIKISAAVEGKQYGLDHPKETFLASAADLKSDTIKLKTLTVNPALTADVLEPYKGTIEKILHQPVSFQVGYKTITPTPADIASWLEITPDSKSKKVDIAVNSGKVQEYINNTASKYIYPAKAQVETQQPDGTTKVLVAGVNGVDVTNKSAAAAAVSKSVLEGKGISLALTVSYEPFKTITAASYDKWIEVDLTHKRMYAYEKDSLVRTYLVSAGAPATPTVTGQYSIYSKFAKQDMRGNNVDGSRYFQPNVRWVNYFYKDYAIHGNYWRPLSYFGNINSSHGCVSLVEPEAEWIYSWAPIGTPVIVHT